MSAWVSIPALWPWAPQGGLSIRLSSLSIKLTHARPNKPKDEMTVSGVVVLEQGSSSLPIAMKLCRPQDGACFWIAGLNGDITRWMKVTAGGDWGQALPTPVCFEEASFYFAEDRFGLYGSIKGLGKGVLLRQGSTDSYLFAFGLGDSFSFGKLWSSLAPIDAYLAVKDAHLLLLSKQAEIPDLQRDLGEFARAVQPSDPSFVVPFTEDEVLPREPGQTGLKPGVWISAKLDWTRGSLTGAFGRMSSEPPPSLLVSARITHDDLKNTWYRAELSHLKLLGGHLTLDGSFIYTPGTLDCLKIQGRLAVSLESATPVYVFDGELSVREKDATFIERASPGTDHKSSESLDAPLGMSGVVLRQLDLVEAKFKLPSGGRSTSYVKLVGSADWGKHCQLVGALLWVNGVPRVATVKLAEGEELSVSEIFSGILKGSEWPFAEPLSFQGGELYYANLEAGQDLDLADAAPAPVSYRAGYHLRSTVRIFDVPFRIDIEIHKAATEEKTGIVATGTYPGTIAIGPQGMALVSLTGYPDAQTGRDTEGPTVSISTIATHGHSFRLDSGFRIFGASFRASFSYQKEQKLFAGTATYDGRVFGCNNPSFGFVYADKKLKITSLPLVTELTDRLDYAKVLEQASEFDRKKCGQLVELAFDKAIKTKFDVSVSLSDTAAGGNLPLVIKGKFTITVAGEHIPSLDLPDLNTTISAPPDTPGGLLLWLEDTLVSKAVSIIGQLLDPKNHAQAVCFFALFTVKDFSEDLIKSLLCRGIDSDNIKRRYVQFKLDNYHRPDSPADDFERGIKEALAAAGVAVTIAALAAQVECAKQAVSQFQKLVDDLLKLAKKFWKALTGQQQDEVDEAENRLNQAKAKQAQTTQILLQKLAMEPTPTPTAVFLANGALQVNWTDGNRPRANGFDYQGYRRVAYSVEAARDASFANPIGQPVETNLFMVPAAETRNQCLLTSADLAHADTVYVRIRAVYYYLDPLVVDPLSLGVRYPASDTGCICARPARHIIPLTAPNSVGVRLDAEHDDVLVTVSAVAQATEYRVELVEVSPGGATLAGAMVPAPTGDSAKTVSCPFACAALPSGLPSGTRLLARAMALGPPDLYGPSDPRLSEGAPIPTFGPVTSPRVTLVAEGAEVEWSPEAGVVYQVAAVDDEGTLLDPQPELLMRPSSCLLSGPALTDGATLRVQLRGRKPEAVGLWSRPTAVTIRMLPAPKAFDAFYDLPSGTIRLTWQDDTKALDHQVEIEDSACAPLSSPTVTITANGASLVGAAIVVGGQYRVRARARADAAVTTWTTWRTVFTEKIAAPQALRWCWQHGNLQADWSTVQAASAYDLSLVASDGTWALNLKTASSSVTLGAGEGVQLRVGQVYQLRVRARVRDVLGPPAVAQVTLSGLLSRLDDIRATGASVIDAVRAALAANPAVSPHELFVTLAAVGYGVDESQAAVHGQFPHADLCPARGALGSLELLWPLLHTDGVAVPVIMELVVRVCRPQPVEVAIRAKQAGLAQGDVVSSLTAAYPSLAPEHLTSIARAVLAQPWGLGSALSEARIPSQRALDRLLAAHPTLRLEEAMAALQGGGYSLADLALVETLQARYQADVTKLAMAQWILCDSSGRSLAMALLSLGDDGSAVAGYLSACFKTLTAKQIEEAILAPSQGGELKDLVFDFNKAPIGAMSIPCEPNDLCVQATFTSNTVPTEPPGFPNGVVAFVPNVFILHNAGSAQRAAQRFVKIVLNSPMPIQLYGVQFFSHTNASDGPIQVAVEGSSRDDFADASLLGTLTITGGNLTEKYLPFKLSIPAGRFNLRFRETSATPDGSNYIAYRDVRLEAKIFSVVDIASYSNYLPDHGIATSYGGNSPTFTVESQGVINRIRILTGVYPAGLATYVSVNGHQVQTSWIVGGGDGVAWRRVDVVPGISVQARDVIDGVVATSLWTARLYPMGVDKAGKQIVEVLVDPVTNKRS